MREAAENQQPDPQQQLMEAGAAELIAKAQKAEADTQWTLARTDETVAKTAETMAGIDQADRRLALEAAEKLAAAAQPQQMGETGTDNGNAN